MTFDPEQAEILRLRLSIQQTLDGSAQMSYLESARFRIELMVALERHEKHAVSSAETLATLEELSGRVGAGASPVL